MNQFGSPALVDASIRSGRGVLRGARQISVAVFAALVLLVGLVSGSSEIQYGLLLSTVYGIAVLGNNALFATSTAVGFGAIAPLAIGAYATAYFCNLGVPVLLSIPIAIALAAIVGAVVAMPMVRLRGIATALATFALSYAIFDLATFARPLTNGDIGTYLPFEFGIGPVLVSGTGGMLVFATAVMLLLGQLSIVVFNGSWGRRAILAGEAEIASKIFGARVGLARLGVWAWASAVGGAAGALYGLATGFVHPSQFILTTAVFLFAGGLIGGVRSAVGAWVGGLLAGGVPLWAQNVIPPQALTLCVGIVLLVALFLGGQGLSPAIESLATRILIRRPGRTKDDL